MQNNMEIEYKTVLIKEEKEDNDELKLELMQHSK